MNPLVGVSVPAYEAWNIQYATVTDKSPKDFSPIPGLAESWKGSADGKTWTYTMRANQKWSDGQPLTAEDVAYTINRAKKEEWLNYTSVVANLTAKATDDRTLVVTSSVADPKLPTLDMYVLPKHIWEKQDAKAITKYAALDGVGSGPFTLEHLEKGQFARFKANPYYYGGKPAVDRVVLRNFDNPDAMVAALKRGEIDAAEDVPGTAFHQLEKDPNIVTVQGNQGAMDEFAINGGAGLKKPHPALADLRVRQAIAHAIDKKTIVNRVLAGLGTPAEALSTSPNPEWAPEIPAGQRYDFDLDKANQILDAGGLQGHQRRRHPRDARRRAPAEVPLRGALRGRCRPADGRAHQRLAAQDRDRDHAEGLRRQPPHRGHRQGRLRPLRVGLDAVRRPRSDALVLHLRPGQQGPQGPDELLQRRELVRPAVRRALQAAEGRARQGQARRHRPPDADALLRVGRLRRALHVPRPAGLSQEPLHRLDPPAREDRAGAVLQQLADLRAPEARGGGHQGRRRR